MTKQHTFIAGALRSSTTRCSPNKKISSLIPFLLFAFAWLLIGLSPAITGAFTRSEPSGILGITHLVAVVTIVAIVSTVSVEWSLILLALILPWQPLFSMPLAHTLGGSGIKMLVATKEVYAVTLLGLLFLGRRKKHRWVFVDVAAMLFVTVYILYMVVSPASFFTRLVSFREGFMIVAFYFVGRLSGLDQTKLRTVLRIVVMIAVLVALFGYIERFVFNNSTWNQIGAGEYMAMKFGPGNPGTGLMDGIPSQWYTYVGGAGSGYKLLRRMVGPIGDATSLSRFLAFPILVLIFVKNLFGKRPRFLVLRGVLMFTLGGAVLLSLGRGGMVIVLGGILLWLFVRNRWVAIMLGVFSLLLMTSTTLFDIQSGSNARHISNLIKGIQVLQISPLGRGLGTSGQLALSFGEKVGEEEKVRESYCASLAAQMGFPGLGAYLLFVATLLSKLYSIFRKDRVDLNGEIGGMALLGLASIGGMFVTSALANSAVAPISAGLPLLFAGAIVGMQQNRLLHSGVKMLGEGD